MPSVSRVQGVSPGRRAARVLPGWFLCAWAKGKYWGGETTHTDPNFDAPGKNSDISNCYCCPPPALDFLFEGCFFCHRLAAVVTYTCKGLVLFGK